MTFILDHVPDDETTIEEEVRILRKIIEVYQKRGYNEIEAKEMADLLQKSFNLDILTLMHK